MRREHTLENRFKQKIILLELAIASCIADVDYTLGRNGVDRLTSEMRECGFDGKLFEVFNSERDLIFSNGNGLLDEKISLGDIFVEMGYPMRGYNQPEKTVLGEICNLTSDKTELVLLVAKTMKKYTDISYGDKSGYFLPGNVAGEMIIIIRKIGFYNNTEALDIVLSIYRGMLMGSYRSIGLVRLIRETMPENADNLLAKARNQSLEEWRMSYASLYCNGGFERLNKIKREVAHTQVTMRDHNFTHDEYLLHRHGGYVEHDETDSDFTICEGDFQESLKWIPDYSDALCGLKELAEVFNSYKKLKEIIS